MSIFRFVITSKTSRNRNNIVLFRPSKSGGGNCKCLVLKIICDLCNVVEIDLIYLDGDGKLCNFAAEIQ